MEMNIPKNRYNSESKETDLTQSAFFAIERVTHQKEQQIG